MIRYEEMSLNAWPALTTVVHKGCLLRVSNGYTKRANSANPLYTPEQDFTQVVEYSENFYRSRNLPVIFKLPDSASYPGLDRMLEAGGYRTVDLTHVMELDLETVKPVREDGVVIDDGFSGEWINAFAEHNDIGRNRRTAELMLESITCTVIVASAVLEGRIIACGYGAVENPFVGFYDIVVGKEHRGNGFGRKIMNGIIARAIDMNMKRGYLSVVAANEVAKNLYHNLGFRRLYDYRYRVKS